MEAFTLDDNEPHVIGIICAWCNRETTKPIRAFDGSMLCVNQNECWYIGVKLSHSVKIDPARMAGEVPASTPKALNLREGIPTGRIA